MQNNFILALIAMVRLEDRCNSQRSNQFLFFGFLLTANHLRNKPELLLLTSKQITTIISQPKFYCHLSEAP
jgi:hypothetical protein